MSLDSILLVLFGAAVVDGKVRPVGEDYNLVVVGDVASLFDPRLVKSGDCQA